MLALQEALERTVDAAKGLLERAEAAAASAEGGEVGLNAFMHMCCLKRFVTDGPLTLLNPKSSDFFFFFFAFLWEYFSLKTKAMRLFIWGNFSSFPNQFLPQNCVLPLWVGRYVLLLHCCCTAVVGRFGEWVVGARWVATRSLPELSGDRKKTYLPATKCS